MEVERVVDVLVHIGLRLLAVNKSTHRSEFDRILHLTLGQ